MIIHLFFREVYHRGLSTIPKDSPIIFVCAPHANQFIDPMMLITSVNQQVSFLAAKKSMDRKYIGMVGKSLGAIPVTRAQDLTFKGSGQITLDTFTTTLYGIGTKFTSELAPKSVIKFEKTGTTATVVDVIDDTTVTIRDPIPSNESFQEFIHNAVDFKVIPHVDQADMFKSVVDRLLQGGNIGIFPEGGSHDRTDFLPLKAGATIMALAAMQANPNLNVKIVPVGLSYFHPHRFRSRAVIEFGQAISVSPDLVEEYNKGGKNKRVACERLLDTILHSLKAITVTAPDYDKLMVIQAARRLYKPVDKKLTPSQTNELTRRLIKGYLRYQTDSRVIKLTERVSQYNKKLRAHGIRDHQVKNTFVGVFVAMQRLLWRFVMGLFASVSLLPGFFLNLPVMIITERISRKKQAEALAASSVKLKGKDVVSTWKVIVASVVIPLTYFIESLVITLGIYFGVDYEVYQTHPLVIFFSLFLGIIPTVSYLSVFMMEFGGDVLRSLKPLFVAIFKSRQFIDDLKKTRGELERDIVDIIDELGPEVYDNFEQERIRAPPSLRVKPFNLPTQPDFAKTAPKSASSDDSHGGSVCSNSTGDFDSGDFAHFWSRSMTLPSSDDDADWRVDIEDADEGGIYGRRKFYSQNSGKLRQRMLASTPPEE